METPIFSKKSKPPESNLDSSDLWYYQWKDNTDPKDNKYKNLNYSNHYIASHPNLKLRLQCNLTNYFAGR